jgi:hypothetical protein
LAGILTEEPVPRAEPGPWSEFWPRAFRVVTAPPPTGRSERSFLDVLQARRSAIGGPIGFQQVADLLWYATAPTPMGIGRAGLPIEHRPYPSAGALHCIRLVAIDSERREVALYEPAGHRFHLLDAPLVVEVNDRDVEAMVGRKGGCTLRLIADYGKVAAAYRSPESLLYREAGCVLATLGLCAEWLGQAACNLGSVGQSLVPMLGFPEDSFAALGGLQICGGLRGYDLVGT